MRDWAGRWKIALHAPCASSRQSKQSVRASTGDFKGKAHHVSSFDELKGKAW